jgi:hypothetical protein
VSTDAAISAQASAWKAMERASDNFGLCDPATGIHFVTGKKASGASKSRWPNEFTATETRERKSQQAKDREAKKRAARGNTCVNGHPLTADNVSSVGNGVFNCIACRRARQGRVNEMRRRAYALMSVAA